MLLKKRATKVASKKNVAANAPTLFQLVRKRDSRVVPFDQTHIANAVLKAMTAAGEGGDVHAVKVAHAVVVALLKKYPANYVLGIEEIQDAVEFALITFDYPKTAKAYILYRQERARLREERRGIPPRVKQLVTESKKYFRSSLSEFIYYKAFSRWISEEGRRETWIETVDRYMNYMRENLGDFLRDAEYQELREGILLQEAMPSMRLLWGAGPAALAAHMVAYNCSFIAPSKLEDFGEIMMLSMCGCGVGFSAEEQSVQRLPQIERQTGKILPTHVIADSKEGWASATVLGLKTWFAGKDIQFDYSCVRPAGARLKTMGGKSSGPAPLRDLLTFARKKILARQGRRLRTIDVHDIVCKVGEIVVAGGVRRSALISLSDLDDTDMRFAKSGQFYMTEPQRMMANNSVAYNSKPTCTEFMDEWAALAKNGTGERGIFNRGGLQKQMPARRWKVFAADAATSGTNPCGEIILKSKEFCNLTEVVARPDDTKESLLRKIRLTTILGTYQSTLTNFPFLSKEWKKNCETERLLGVSITGQWDCPVVRDPAVLAALRDEAIRVNKEYAKRFKINQSTCVTCVKPSGELSQLVDSSSGLHPRHAPYYIRRVRIAATDSLFRMLRDQKVPYHPEVGQLKDTATTFVLEFPIKAPEETKYKNDFTAIDQLEYWKMVKENYTEHNPSVTVSVGADEWIAVGNWVYEHWDMVGGLSFLPREDHVYSLAPYEAISEQRYKEMKAAFPDIDFSQILLYEKDDETKGSKTLACVSGVCEVA